MTNQKAFSLMEFVVTMLIIAILAAVSIPAYISNAQRGASTAAQNNLTAIYNGEKTFYLNKNAYCTTATGICNSTASINANLSLNITDNNFSYNCQIHATGFTCQATNNGTATFVLTLINSPIVLPGGAGVLNPSCTYPANPDYCPS